MTTLKICEEQPKHSGSAIRVCDEKSAEPGAIRVCFEDEPDPCRDSESPVVSGDADCNVGDIYIASGGVPPYVWAFTGGTIDQSGEIQSIDSCGDPGSDRSSTVTVTDSCGRYGELAVRLPGGVWGSGTVLCTKPMTGGCYISGCIRTDSEIIGDTKLTYFGRCTDPAWGCGSGCGAPATTSFCPSDGCPAAYTNFWSYRIEEQKWVCP